MGRASRRKQETRAKKLQDLELESYRHFFPHGVDELSISTTGWLLLLSPPLIKKLVEERQWSEFILYKLMRCGWTYCPQTDSCYEGFTTGRLYIPNPQKSGLKLKIPSSD